MKHHSRTQERFWEALCSSSGKGNSARVPWNSRGQTSGKTKKRHISVDPKSLYTTLDLPASCPPANCLVFFCFVWGVTMAGRHMCQFFYRLLLIHCVA